MNRLVDRVVDLTPAILIGVFVLVLLNALANGQNFTTQAFHGSFLLMAAAALTYFRRFLETRQ
ncbi:hypothetical protein [Porphyrobacter sp. AAP60]|uniref:hypothetical protein n=1 Tax=Porphyrobacter sp. AAP60 TaxID=1523423 RepID=UPI0006B886C7|nr:hypothetical protein [Porphyrobacter sp. AAP60]KPF65267.1 hypothetical protein IP79_03640 [Porphyrobacter sp. AAP60]